MKFKKQALLASVIMPVLLLAACGGIGFPGGDREVLPEGGNPIPTPRVGQLVGDDPDSQAASTPEETYRRFINDSIAAQVSMQKTETIMRQRYQDPSITAQDLGGLVTDIAVLEDRTSISTPSGRDDLANVSVDLDIRITFADGDSDTRTCLYQLSMQRAANEDGDDVWYVINPNAFPVYYSCSAS